MKQLAKSKLKDDGKKIEMFAVNLSRDGGWDGLQHPRGRKAAEKR